MNHIYRSLWNEALGAWIAVSEISKGQGKRSSNRRPLLAASLLLFSSANHALPTGEQLIAGQASVSTPNANTLQINQASQNAVINWQGFSVAQQEAVNIQQPNTQAALLNRVVGQDASQIQGQINANGQVYLVNPNGVVFGKTAQVDVGGLVASTHNINDADFMNGKNHFTQDGATGSVENHGTINTAEGGVVALIAEQVSNTGTINTPKGTTALAAGKTVDLEFQGNGLVEVKVSEAALNTQITNQGAIQADGGRVILSAKAAGQLIDTVINQQGIIRAQGLVERNGEIILDGGEKGITQINGILDADAHATGGTIKVTGEHIQINNGATVTASGHTSGGIIQIGDKQSTQQTTLQQHTTVSAKTQNNGKAGTIEILANMHNGTVNVEGKLDASAPTNGDGGYIDTSAAHVNIAESTNITTKATNGNTGTWLIDPNDYTIAADGGDITGLALSNNLKTSNVIISTATQGTAGGNGDIFVNDVVAWSSNLLTLFAERNININATMNGSGTAQLALRYRQGEKIGNYFINAAVNLPAGNNFSILSGLNGVVKNYTVITQLGAENSLTTTDLQGMNGNLGLNYALGADIDASPTSTWNGGDGFLPVSGITGAFTPFTGSFDGLGHAITGLTINRPTTNAVGLFGYSKAFIQNVGLEGGNVTGQTGVGGLLGYNAGIVSNAYNTGSVTGNTGTGIGTDGVGGLVGSSAGLVMNSYATGNVHGANAVGGLLGGNYNSKVINSFATGDVSGDINVGGLVGVNTPMGEFWGGSIDNSYATGNVSGNINVGGLVGGSLISVNNVYATGNVSGNSQVGGLVGGNGGQYHYARIINAYATGNVSGNNFVGGLVGKHTNPGAGINVILISNSFWDTESTGQAINGVGNGNLAGATGKTTAEMQQLATFSSSAWDITNTDGGTSVWRIFEGNTTPLLTTTPLLRSFLTPLPVNETSTPSNDTLNVDVASNPNVFLENIPTTPLVDNIDFTQLINTIDLATLIDNNNAVLPISADNSNTTLPIFVDNSNTTLTTPINAKPVTQTNLLNLDFWLSQLSPLQTTGTFLDQYTQQLANHNSRINADLEQYQGELYQLIGYEWQTKQGKQ
jgi:filamentous hemagglutinin family protein